MQKKKILACVLGLVMLLSGCGLQTNGGNLGSNSNSNIQSDSGSGNQNNSSSNGNNNSSSSNGNDETEKIGHCKGGILTVENNNVTFLSSSFEWK